MDQKSITTADFIRHFGRYHEEAQRGPLTLTKHGRPSLVVMSAEAYERHFRTIRAGSTARVRRRRSWPRSS